jgi:hypothetical protein
MTNSSKYWEYDDGIYFTVLDPQFFADHKGQRLRFSLDGVEFHDTGLKLPAAAAPAAKSKARGKSRKGKTAKSKAEELPLQADVLK